MIIRPFEIADQNQVIELWRLSGLTTPQNNPAKDIQRKLQVDPDLFLVALSESISAEPIITGTIMGGYDGHRGWVNYLGVSPAYQRQGIASKLMHHLEGLLAAKGCPKINLQVRASNSQALQFYTALGYLDDKVVGLGKRLEHD